MARAIPKPINPTVQVFPRAAAVARKSAVPRFVPLRKIAPDASILPAAAPRNHELRPPTLIQTLVARKDAAGDGWPPNLRIEPVISRTDWAPVKKGLRSKLKRMLREE
jgi:hypothetical protein